MRFGLLYDFRNPVGSPRSTPALYAQTLDQIATAESDWGFDDIWVTEHHFIDDGYLPALLPMAAAIAARTSSVRIGTFVLLQPFHNPVRLAEDCAVVDNISNGRFLFGPGVGYRYPEFMSFNIDRRYRGSITDEAVQIMIKCWEEEEFSFEGEHFTFHNVRCTPKPVQKPRIPVWFGATQGEALRRAARLGDGLLHTIAAPPDAPARFVQHLKEYGKDWRNPHILNMSLLFTSENPERDWQLLAPSALYHAQGYATWYAQDQNWQQGTTPATFGGSYPHTIEDVERLGHYLVATPDEIIQHIKALYAQYPFEAFLYTAVWPGIDPEVHARSHQLFAEEVAPALRDLGG